MLKSKDGDFFVSDWLRNRNTEGLIQSERLIKLNKIAISQMKILNNTDIKYLK